MQVFHARRSRSSIAANHCRCKLDELRISSAIAGWMPWLPIISAARTVMWTSSLLAAIVGHSTGNWTGSARPPFPGSKNLKDVATGVRIDFIVTGQFPGDGQAQAGCVSRSGPVGRRNRRHPVSPSLHSVGTQTCLGHDQSRPLERPGGRTRTHSHPEIASRFLAPQLDPFVQSKFDELWQGVANFPAEGCNSLPAARAAGERLSNPMPPHYNVPTTGDLMRHVISALVINEPGVLANVAGMFAARGFNIDSLVVGRTEDPSRSRMTIVVNADENTLDQVRNNWPSSCRSSRSRISRTRLRRCDLAMVTVAATAGQSRRGHRDRPTLPRQDRGRVTGRPGGRTGRHRGQDRSPDRNAASVRHPRNGPHWSDRHVPRDAAGKRPSRRRRQGKKTQPRRPRVTGDAAIVGLQEYIRRSPREDAEEHGGIQIGDWFHALFHPPRSSVSSAVSPSFSV